MIGNLSTIQYYQPFLPTRQFSFRGNIFSSKNDSVVIKKTTIPKENFSVPNKRLNHVKNIKLSKPMPVKEALIKLFNLQDDLSNNSYQINIFDKRHLSLAGRFAKTICEIPCLQGREISGIIGSGSRSIAIDLGINPKTGNHEVLKLANEPNYPKSLERDFEESFDMPIYEQDNIDGIYYYIQQKGEEEGVTIDHLREIRNKIEQKKKYILNDLELNDGNKKQIALYKGKAFLIDPECAKKP